MLLFYLSKQTSCQSFQSSSFASIVQADEQNRDTPKHVTKILGSFVAHYLGTSVYLEFRFQHEQNDPIVVFSSLPTALVAQTTNSCGSNHASGVLYTSFA